MKIAICSSLDFIEEIKEVSEKLKELGHEVVLPQTAEMILGGELTHKEILKEKKNGKFAERGVRQDSLKNYFREIEKCDAILVLNLEKKGVKGYVGGAAFLETGFAHVLFPERNPANSLHGRNSDDAADCPQWRFGKDKKGA